SRIRSSTAAVPRQMRPTPISFAPPSLLRDGPRGIPLFRDIAFERVSSAGAGGGGSKRDLRLNGPTGRSGPCVRLLSAPRPLPRLASGEGVQRGSFDVRGRVELAAIEGLPG